MTRKPSVVELLGAGIQALGHADAMQLEDLAEAARRTGWPQTAQEQRMARERLRTLAMLMELTKRNLRLLRGTGRHTPLDG
jgi:hypothetical protein